MTRSTVTEYHDLITPGTGHNGPMARLLVAHHSPTAHLATLLRAVEAGARDDAIDGVEVEVRAVAETLADHINEADAVLLVTPTNFGYMAGMVKDLFDRTFLEIGGALDAHGGGAAKAGRKPYGLCIHGRYDTEGGIRSIQSITQALGWNLASPVLSVLGDVTPADEAAAYELGATLSALLMD